MPFVLSCRCGHRFDADADRPSRCPRCDAAVSHISATVDHISEPQTTADDVRRAPSEIELPVVPGYEVESVLGRGGMGVVYRARHLALKRTVALKMILAGSHAAPGERARFRAEVETVARLQHANIVQIHDVGEVDGHPYCALELVEGGSLAARLAGQPMAAIDAARLIMTLAEAMHLAHSRNVVHRDLKPANVLLTADGTPKITDFGLAKTMDLASPGTDSGGALTIPGAIMGTPSYMAPEQAGGEAHTAGPACDVYALGATLYECLTGKPPFTGPTVLEVLDRVRTSAPARIRTLQPGVPVDIETICLKCLAKEPERRYSSARELADDLGRCLRGEPVTARPVGALERLWLWRRRNPALATLSAALVLVLFGAAVGSTIIAFRFVALADQRDKERIAAEEARDEAQTSQRRTERALGMSTLVEAQAAWRDGQVARAQVLCEDVTEDGRSWDWAYLRRKYVGTTCMFHAHDAFVARVAWSPDGRLLVSAATDGSVIVRDALTEKEIRQFKAHDVAGGSGRIANGHDRGDLGIWDVRTEGPHQALTGCRLRTNGLAFRPDGQRLACAGGASQKFPIQGELAIWDPATGDLLRTLEYTAPLTVVEFSPDGKMLATGTQPGPILLWQENEDKPIATLTGHSGTVYAIKFHPDGKRLISSGADGTVRVWDIARSEVLAMVQRSGWQSGMSLSADGSMIAVGGDVDGSNTTGGEVFLWSIDGGEPTVLGRQPKGVNAVAFSPNDQLIASIGRAGRVYLWDVPGRRLQREFQAHSSSGTALSFSPDGRRLATLSFNRELRVWDVETSREVLSLKGPPQPGASVVFSPDGRWLAACGGAPVIAPFRGDTWLWDAGPANNPLARRAGARLDPEWHAEQAENTRKVGAENHAAAFHARLAPRQVTLPCSRRANWQQEAVPTLSPIRFAQRCRETLPGLRRRRSVLTRAEKSSPDQ